MNSKHQLDKFTEYCKNHPEERFWQALCNWVGADKVLVEKDDERDDTFNWG